MGDYVYRGNIEYAEMWFQDKAYGPARCEFQACLEKEKRKRRNRNYQKIEYLERKIKECDELQSQ